MSCDINYNINAMYFSPTGTTEKIVKQISFKLKDCMKNSDEIQCVDFTSFKERTKTVNFSRNDIVVFGVPVYAGRVPNVLLTYLSTVKSDGALAVAAVVYGNRNFDDALIELRDILESNGFRVIAAGAFIGEHSFSETLAARRPDEEDIRIAVNFAEQVCEKIICGKEYDSFVVPGNKPYNSYYRPKNKQGCYVDIRKVKPKTEINCVDCKLCAESCPMGSINHADVSMLNGICIKCGACVKKCPVNAKYFDDEDYLRHKEELELEFAARREPEFFL